MLTTNPQTAERPVLTLKSLWSDADQCDTPDEPRTTEFMFNELTDEQQQQAVARFYNAKPNDWYWYLITTDGLVLSRNKSRQVHG